MEKEDRSLWLILAGIVGFSLWYTLTKRSDNALWLVLAAVCTLMLAYRLYGGFMAARVAGLSDAEPVGISSRLSATRWVLFGYQFAMIAGAGVLVGPVLAAQFGYLPGYLWTLVAAVAAGAVHDLVVLVASARRKGAFLPVLVAEELGPWAGVATWGIVAVALPVFLAVAGSLLADLLVANAWAIYVVAATIIIGIVVAVYETWLRPGRTGEAVGLGVALAIVAMLIGTRLAMQPLLTGLLTNRAAIILLIGVYCFVSAVLPIHLLGLSRGALWGGVLLTAVMILAFGIAFAAPSLRQPITAFTSGGGPLVSGGVFPYLIILVAGGAISGFNGLVTTAITSRLLKQESDALPVGFGAMLVQALLVVLILISVSTLQRWDFYAITTTSPFGELERLAQSGQRDWDNLRNTLQMDKVRFPGGPTNEPKQENVRAGATTAISAASAWLFRDVPGFNRGWLPALYRFVFVLQALILFAVVEAATRVGRVAIEEVGTVAMRALAGSRQNKGVKLAIVIGGTLVFTLLWSVLALNADVSALLGLLALVSLLLAAVGLGVGVMSLRKTGRWYAAAVAIPLIIVVGLVAVVAVANVRDSAQYLGRRQALVRSYTDMPRWSTQLRFVNPERASETVRAWKPDDLAARYIEKGQAEVARELQGRLGISEQDARKLVATIGSRATGLSLWSWLHIVLTLLLLLLGVAVVAGHFVRVPLSWPVPARVQPAVSSAPPTLEAKEPVEGTDFEI